MPLPRAALVSFALALGTSPAPAQEPPLVARDRVQLNLAGAETVLAAAQKKAAALGLRANIAVVDDGGHLLAFARMDGARPASVNTALIKAMSAAIFRQETGPLPAKGEPNIAAAFRRLAAVPKQAVVLVTRFVLRLL
jgi:glc operon protein GlcG